MKAEDNFEKQTDSLINKLHGLDLMSLTYTESEYNEKKKELIESYASEIASKQRWAASLWVEDSSILEMPLVTNKE